VTLAEACARTGVSRSALGRARRELGPAATPSREDLLLAAITRNGDQLEGALPDLRALASWLDYTNHDGSSTEEVAGMLDELAARGVIALTEGRYRLLVPWP
jgi:hypothetical protein